MSIYTHLVAAAVSAMLGFYVGHGLETGKCDSDKLEAAKAYASQFEMARRQEHEWQTKYQLGVEDARKREKQLALDAAAAAGAAAGLRHTVSGLRTDLSNASADAVQPEPPPASARGDHPQVALVVAAAHVTYSGQTALQMSASLAWPSAAAATSRY